MAETESIILGGGCFWCIEELYNELEGIDEAISGYAAGHKADPTYREVCNATTGHAEVVDVTFDPDVISLREILEIFFVMHNPTTKNRQGNDVGPQYRSIVLYRNDEQKKITEEVMQEIEDKSVWKDPIVTEVEPLAEEGAGKFWRAEEYHQRYFAKNPGQGYCQVVIAPKVSKLRKQYFDKLKDKYKN